MKMRAIVTGAFLLFSSGVAMSQQYGADSSIGRWLSGDDVNSLTALASEAASGDSKAQLLLGQIDRDTVPGGFSDYLLSMSDADRDALLRAVSPEGTINWLLVLSDSNLQPLGDAMFNYRVDLQPLRAALALQSTGEFEAAEFTLWNILNNGRFDVVNSLPAENYGLSEAGFLKWVGAYLSNPNKALTMNRFAGDPSPDKVTGLLAVARLARVLNLNQYLSEEIKQVLQVIKGQGYDLPEETNLVTLNEDLRRIAETDGPINIVARFCSRCSGDRVDYDCMIQALEIIDGYKTLLAVRTPVEKVIEPAEFMASERPVRVLEQLLKVRSGYYKRPIRSQCIADHIAAAN